ncbi:MAG: hypothetical protein KA146_09370 [Leptospiraceae bacterium]|nr:hypothetical protein [Leptospiraceae bacterium]
MKQQNPTRVLMEHSRSVKNKKSELRAFFSFLLTSFFSFPRKKRKKYEEMSPTLGSGIKENPLTGVE